MLKLIQTELGVFDLAYETSADDLQQTALATAIYAALLTDQRAADGRVDDPFDQRGWWYDPQRGTGWWYVRRQALSDAARRETLNMAKRALDALPAFTDVEITEVQTSGNISSVTLEITGSYYGRRFKFSEIDTVTPSTETLSSDVWDVVWDVDWVDAPVVSLFDVEFDVVFVN